MAKKNSSSAMQKLADFVVISASNMVMFFTVGDKYLF